MNDDTHTAARKLRQRERAGEEVYITQTEYFLSFFSRDKNEKKQPQSSHHKKKEKIGDRNVKMI
jgi:hypothetical protein